MFSDKAKSLVVGGEYEHYSGKRYNLVAIAHDSETLEELVVYHAEYGDGLTWVHRLENFLRVVEVDGVSKPRFRYVGDN